MFTLWHRQGRPPYQQHMLRSTERQHDGAVVSIWVPPRLGPLLFFSLSLCALACESEEKNRSVQRLDQQPQDAGTVQDQSSDPSPGDQEVQPPAAPLYPDELGAFEPWKRPIETYLTQARAELGDGVDAKIHDLIVFEDRLYIGYGDADRNAGGVSPIQILSFSSPEAETAEADPLETGEEGIYQYRKINGELMIAGADSTNDDELTSRPLIEGNFLRTREGRWEKYRSVPGGEHVHDVATFMEGLWAVGSGADNRDEWENEGVFRYLWFSEDGGVSWSTLKRRFRESAGDTRWIQLLSIEETLYIFGYHNGGSLSPRNESMQGMQGLPEPLPEGHPLADVFVTVCYPLSQRSGLISGIVVEEGRRSLWYIEGDKIQEVNPFEGGLLVDLSQDESGQLVALVLQSGVGLNSHKVWIGESLETFTLRATESWPERAAPSSISAWQGRIYLGMSDGSIWRSP
ncbi:MAG: hypothetical protein VYD19_08660 [Myxococcota bacterium]|nr:hypothetical protein [Myxococcota bacterium]